MDFIKSIYTPNPKQTKNKTINLILTIIGYASIVLFPAICLFVLEYIHYANKELFLKYLSDRVSAIVFMLVVLYLIFAALLLLVKRAWIASLLFGGSFCLVTVTNYFKFAMTGDHFYPWDLVQASNVSILATYLKTPIPILYVLMLVFIIALIAVISISRVGIPVKWFVRIPAALLIVVIMLFSVSTPLRVQTLLNKNGLFLEDMALQQSNYRYNGFAAATTVNLLSNNVSKPENYSEKTINDLLSKYDYIPESSDFVKPDIIAVLCESFWDIRNLPNTEFSINPLENFDSIAERDNCYSGLFFTTGFGGGTVRPEFEFLSGITTDNLPGGAVPYQYIHDEFDCYLTNYKNIGYKAMMLHPYLSNFYLRQETYGYLGFDELYFDTDLLAINDVEVSYSGQHISDDSFVDYIEYLLGANPNTPSFIFGITMENHQPYPTKYEPENIEVTVTCPNMSEDILAATTQYTQGVINSDRALGKLIDYVDSRERPTIVVFFGDHAPSLGANYAAYAQSGLVADSSSLTPEERHIIQSTPYMIYSNYDIPDNPDSMVKRGKNNDIASYNVLNALATLINSPQTPYMQFLRDYYNSINYYNIRLNLTVTPEAARFIENHQTLTYDRISGNKYSFFDN
jgi:Phosphoglycerol transferase and related proteins, alkaline phosphatase superfamily